MGCSQLFNFALDAFICVDTSPLWVGNGGRRWYLMAAKPWIRNYVELPRILVDYYGHGLAMITVLVGL
jgi:hypothetical protein